MTKLRVSLGRVLTMCGLGAAIAAGMWAMQTGAGSRGARAGASSNASMSELLPQGALLTIESPDFAALLKRWNQSPEQKAWLASANYRVFSNSRLFGRLSDASSEFASATGNGENAVDLDSKFLTQVAGHESIFAWYNVGNLEFVYITRMSSAQAAATALVQHRSGFQVRQAAGATFYLRHSSDSETGTARWVAFAQVPTAQGDLLVLATREDLMAGALELIQHKAVAGSAAKVEAAQSLAQEPWYASAEAALPRPGSAPALHMVLNLDRIVPMPYFRSYWVQQNITEMKQYRSAVSDLYFESDPASPQFREERVLLAKGDAETGIGSDPGAMQTGALAGMVPAGTGVYRAMVTHDPERAVKALEEKLIGRITLSAVPSRTAPNPSLAVSSSGSAADLETSIDTPALVSAASSNQLLKDAMNAAGLDAMLTCSSAAMPAGESGLWVPIHSAVVLHATAAWKPEDVLRGLQQSLRGDLTASTLGIEFEAATVSGETVYALNGPKPLFFSIRGSLWLVSDDRELLLALLHGTAEPARPAGPPALQIAGFDHPGQRAPYRRLTSLIDSTNRQPAAEPSASTDNVAAPAYFSQNLGSLSDAFAALTGERFVERREGGVLRQTVTYQWKRS